MPVEQVRRKTREPTVQNRRTNALKHQHGGSGGGGNTHPGSQIHPSVLKNSGHVNGVNVIGLTGGSASSSNQPVSTSMSSKIANISGASNTMGGAHSQNPSGLFRSNCFLVASKFFARIFSSSSIKRKKITIEPGYIISTILHLIPILNENGVDYYVLSHHIFLGLEGSN